MTARRALISGQFSFSSGGTYSHNIFFGGWANSSPAIFIRLMVPGNQYVSQGRVRHIMGHRETKFWSSPWRVTDAAHLSSLQVEFLLHKESALANDQGPTVRQPIEHRLAPSNRQFQKKSRRVRHFGALSCLAWALHSGKVGRFKRLIVSVLDRPIYRRKNERLRR
jgi:hypothetical protein